MTVYNYLLFDEMVLSWKRELCKLNNEIDSRASNRVSVSLLVRGIINALAKLDRLIDGGSHDTIGSRICTYASETSFDDLPSGLSDRIFGRKELLKYSLKILHKGRQQSELRGDHATSGVRTISGGTEAKG
jgi:hypothetical protein